MESKLNSPNNNKRQGKDTKHENQLQTIFQYLQNHIATASMVTEATGVPQKNICRYKRDLENAGRLWEIKKSICKVTGYKAWFITTNESLRPDNAKQLTLY